MYVFFLKLVERLRRCPFRRRSLSVFLCGVKQLRSKPSAVFEEPFQKALAVSAVVEIRQSRVMSRDDIGEQQVQRLGKIFQRVGRARGGVRTFVAFALRYALVVARRFFQMVLPRRRGFADVVRVSYKRSARSLAENSGELSRELRRSA